MKVSAINNSYINNKPTLATKTRNPCFKSFYKTKSQIIKTGLITNGMFVIGNLTKSVLDLFSQPTTALSIGTLTTLIIALYSYIKGFLTTETPIELEKHIEYTPAKNLEEAENFAKKNFQIKNFKFETLELANWVNEALCNINNRFEGKVYMPKKIKERDLGSGIDGDYHFGFDSLRISNKAFKEPENINKRLISSAKVLLIFAEDIKFSPNQDAFINMVENYIKNPDKFSIIERWMLLDAVNRSLEIVCDLKAKKIDKKLTLEKDLDVNDYGPVDYNPFQTIYHEMGHVFDYKTTPQRIKLSKLFKSIIQNLLVHNYMKKNKKEFAAEGFAGFMNNERYSNEIEDTFHKVTNIRFPDIETTISLNK